MLQLLYARGIQTGRRDQCIIFYKKEGVKGNSKEGNENNEISPFKLFNEGKPENVIDQVVQYWH